MKKLIYLIVIIFAVVFTSIRTCRKFQSTEETAASTTQTPQKPIDLSLQRRSDSLLAAMPPVGSLGLCLYDITAQRVIYSYNENIQKRPASCMKVLTCVAALSTLGPNYEYKTRLYTTGKVVADTLTGDIILKTQFDPAFNRDSLIILLGAIKQKGIKAIKGKVVMDVAFTAPMEHEMHWTPGDLKKRHVGLLYQGYPRLRTEVLYAMHSAAGISIRKEDIVFGRLDYKASTLLAQITTPIHVPVEKALKNSSNFNAESLLYPLGYTISHKGNYRINGTKALRKFISQKLKLDPTSCANIEDGCGLCPDDKMTPSLLIALLTYSQSKSSIYREVQEDLPLSGTDGTLYDRLRKPNVVGKIKAKTGTLTREGGISTLAGYFTGADGHQVAFAIMNNECPVMDGRWWQDKFLERAVFPKSKTNAK